MIHGVDRKRKRRTNARGEPVQKKMLSKKGKASGIENGISVKLVGGRCLRKYSPRDLIALEGVLIRIGCSVVSRSSLVETSG